MSVIIRLQNLPWSANALDIRQFFHGLSIPEGGVHIVGGEQGDAFIAFSTDEDARQAFSRNNGKIKEIQISLMLSSRTEMQKVIEAARAQSYAAFMQTPPSNTPITPNNIPLPAAVPSLIPTAVPEIKIDTTNTKDRDVNTKSDKRERRRSRSKSRERSSNKERRDKRYRDRSRSRSRERRRNRRSERSRSRGRSRSKERSERKNRSDRRRSDDYIQQQQQQQQLLPQRDGGRKSNDSWSNNTNQSSDDVILVQQQQQQQPPSLLNNFIQAPNNRNGFQSNRSNWSQNSNDGFNNMNRQISGAGGGTFQRQRFPTRNFNQQDFLTNDNKSDREIVPNCCIKIQPFHGGYGDIRRFFHRAFISNVGIKFINNELGHRTGIVYVQFGNVQGKQEALQKDGHSLNGVTVGVVHLDDNDFDEAVDRYKPDNYSQDSGDDSRGQIRSINQQRKFFNLNNQQQQHEEEEEEDLIDMSTFTCLTVDDLPTYVKEQDILKMFSTLSLTSLILTTKIRGGQIAYVKFATSEDAKKALDEINHIIEGKPVTVKPCSNNEFETINQQHDVDLNDSTRKKTNQLIDTDCISMSRLPQQTNDIEITDFFSDIGIRPIKIHLMSNRLGFTGQAFCEFKTQDDAIQALKKDSVSFGPNHVSIQLFPREEMENILQQSLMSNVTMPLHNNLLPPQQQQQQQPLLQRPYFNQNPRPFFPRNNNNSNNNNFEGGGGGGRRGGYRFIGQMGGHRPRFMNINNVPHDDAPPGCTVFMDNVPYKAGTNEILDFFDGYDITNNVSRRYNPNNTPSAEAKVVFSTADEAYRAVQERNGQKIWERPIYLKQI